jgi:hypothetical protein
MGPESSGGSIVIQTLRVYLSCGLVLLALCAASPALAEDEDSGTLQPTYEPRPPAEKPIYTTDYLFAITRSITDSTLVPAAQVPLIFLAVPLDIVFLPIEAIAGFFPSDRY